MRELLLQSDGRVYIHTAATHGICSLKQMFTSCLLERASRDRSSSSLHQHIYDVSVQSCLIDPLACVRSSEICIENQVISIPVAYVGECHISDHPPAVAFACRRLKSVGPYEILRHVAGKYGHHVEIRGDLLAQHRHVVFVCNISCSAEVRSVHLKYAAACSRGYGRTPFFAQG